MRGQKDHAHIRSLRFADVEDLVEHFKLARADDRGIIILASQRSSAGPKTLRVVDDRVVGVVFAGGFIFRVLLVNQIPVAKQNGRGIRLASLRGVFQARSVGEGLIGEGKSPKSLPSQLMHRNRMQTRKNERRNAPAKPFDERALPASGGESVASASRSVDVSGSISGDTFR